MLTNRVAVHASLAIKLSDINLLIFYLALPLFTKNTSITQLQLLMNGPWVKPWPTIQQAVVFNSSKIITRRSSWVQTCAWKSRGITCSSPSLDRTRLRSNCRCWTQLRSCPPAILGHRSSWQWTLPAQDRLDVCIWLVSLNSTRFLYLIQLLLESHSMGTEIRPAY